MEKQKLTKKERKALIIQNLKETIAKGGELNTIDTLKKILKNVENDTHVVEKKRGRRPKKSK